MISPVKAAISIATITLLAITLLTNCSSEEDMPSGMNASQTDTSPQNESDVQSITPSKTASTTVITIGNLTDLTSVSANAMNKVNMALDDLVEYYNENNLISGVQLEVIDYDGQMDITRDVPAYDWFNEKGADLIFTAIPAASTTLRSIVNEDEFSLFTLSATMDVLMPPGYTFSLGTIPEYDAYTLLKWIAENDWDYETKGPAKIGGAAWTEGYSDSVFSAMKDYAEVHPEQFQVVGFHLIDLTFKWDSQVEDLKDCDYVWVPLPMHIFVRDYRAAGYDAKFMGSDPHAAFLGMIDKGQQWNELNEMLFIRSSRWWTEEGDLIDLTRELLYNNHSAEAEDIIRTGVGYLSLSGPYQLCNIIKKAAENVGPENVDSQAIYEASISYTETIDGVDRYGFDESKRFSTNYYVVYEVNGAKKDLFRADPDWLPVITEP